MDPLNPNNNTLPDNTPVSTGINPIASAQIPNTAVGPAAVNPPSIQPASPFAQPQASAEQYNQQTSDPSSVANPQTSAVPANPQPAFPQATFPNDAPPSPAPLGQAKPEELVDQPIVSTPKSQGVKKMFLILLIIILVGFLGVGGYYLYGYFIKQNTLSNLTPTPTPGGEAAATDSIVWKTHSSQVLPVEVSIPVNWVINEVQNPDLANQKSITASSVDLTYEGSEISQGYQLSIGPVNDLTTRYVSFEEFNTAENPDGIGSQIVINNIQWIKYPTSAKTLISDLPLVVTLYAPSDQEVLAQSLFNQILENLKVVSTANEVPSSGNP